MRRAKVKVSREKLSLGARDLMAEQRQQYRENDRGMSR
jgi:hypothetical protein